MFLRLLEVDWKHRDCCLCHAHNHSMACSVFIAARDVLLCQSQMAWLIARHVMRMRHGWQRCNVVSTGQYPPHVTCKGMFMHSAFHQYALLIQATMNSWAALTDQTEKVRLKHGQSFSMNAFSGQYNLCPSLSLSLSSKNILFSKSVNCRRKLILGYMVDNALCICTKVAQLHPSFLNLPCEANSKLRRIEQKRALCAQNCSQNGL